MIDKIHLALTLFPSTMKRYKNMWSDSKFEIYFKRVQVEYSRHSIFFWPRNLEFWLEILSLYYYISSFTDAAAILFVEPRLNLITSNSFLRCKTRKDITAV